MKLTQLSKMTVKELQTRLEKVSDELNELRFDVRVGQESDYSTISKKKKEIARIRTLLTETELGLRKPEVKTETKTKSKKEIKTTNKKTIKEK